MSNLNNDITKIMAHESPYSQKREQSELKIYSLWCRWEGVILAIAKSEEEARIYFSEHPLYKYHSNTEIEVTDIKPGIIFECDNR